MAQVPKPEQDGDLPVAVADADIELRPLNLFNDHVDIDVIGVWLGQSKAENFLLFRNILFRLTQPVGFSRKKSERQIFEVWPEAENPSWVSVWQEPDLALDTVQPGRLRGLGVVGEDRQGHGFQQLLEDENGTFAHLINKRAKAFIVWIDRVWVDHKKLQESCYKTLRFDNCCLINGLRKGQVTILAMTNNSLQDATTFRPLLSSLEPPKDLGN